MRKLNVVMIAILLVGVVPKATRAQHAIGFRGGATIANISGDDLNDTNSKTGFTFGGFADLSVSDILGIEIGATFSRKGVKDSEEGEDVRLDLDYLEFPLLAVVNVPTGGAVAPRLYAGPVLSFQTRCSVEVEAPGSVVATDCDNPLFGGDLDTSTFDFGALVGAGIGIDVASRLRLHVDGMFNLGISSVEEIEDEDANRNRALSLTAGVSILLGG